MRPSMIVTLPVTALPEEFTAGYVVLGVVDGLAYVHLAPYAEPQEVYFRDGALSAEPNGGQAGVLETPRPAFAEGADVFYDPAPAAFRWDVFAEAHPALAESPGLDAEGAPLPAPLMPHQWSGDFV